MGGRPVAVAALLVAAAAVLAACGGGGGERTSARATSTSTPTAATTAASAVDVTSHPPVPHDDSADLVFIRRVPYVPDPLDDDLRIQTSGLATFRKGYAGLGRGIATERLPAAQLRRFRRLVARARPAALPTPATNPTRGGYTYTIRAQGGTGAVNSGHLPTRASALVREADRLISRLADHLDFRSLNR